jgi:hypothetical protein
MIVIRKLGYVGYLTREKLVGWMRLPTCSGSRPGTELGAGRASRPGR